MAVFLELFDRFHALTFVRKLLMCAFTLTSWPAHQTPTTSETPPPPAVVDNTDSGGFNKGIILIKLATKTVNVGWF